MRPVRIALLIGLVLGTVLADFTYPVRVACAPDQISYMRSNR